MRELNDASGPVPVTPPGTQTQLPEPEHEGGTVTATSLTVVLCQSLFHPQHVQLNAMKPNIICLIIIRDCIAVNSTSVLPNMFHLSEEDLQLNQKPASRHPEQSLLLLSSKVKLP